VAAAVEVEAHADANVNVIANHYAEARAQIDVRRAVHSDRGLGQIGERPAEGVAIQFQRADDAQEIARLIQVLVQREMIVEDRAGEARRAAERDPSANSICK